ncbi:hypothetical protein [Paracoccus sp. SSK6]|uniref:hypothetical protein n=1 Tax=Paracoccus sp. SSK6 TaxID=3143131 RepID=UPI00321B061E
MAYIDNAACRLIEYLDSLLPAIGQIAGVFFVQDDKARFGFKLRHDAQATSVPC